MKLGIMQPYFAPYIGYWQLLAAVDQFIVYDNIQYTKKGWINRNRFLRNGADALFTIPLKAASDTLDICQRSIAPEFTAAKLLGQFEGSYRKAPRFREAFPVVESMVRAPLENLFEYVAHSVRVLSDYLDIATPIVVSSTVAIDHELRGEAKVLALCQASGADHYVNAIGGQELYSKAAFAEQGIQLSFVKTRPIVYRQFDNPFVANLSIIDVMMFNPKEAIRAMLGEFELV